MIDEIGAKFGIGAIVGIVSYLGHCLTEMFFVYIFLLIMDYVLGVGAKWFLGQKFSRDKAIKGIGKKLACIAFVVLGFLFDFVISHTSPTNTNGTIGSAVIFYLIGTEIWSILKHFGTFGVPVPSFVKTAVETMMNKGKDGK